MEKHSRTLRKQKFRDLLWLAKRFTEDELTQLEALIQKLLKGQNQ